MKDFVTLDFCLAAELMCKGYELSCVKQYGYFMIHLKNHDDIELQKLLKESWDGKSQVDPKRYDRNYNKLIGIARYL